MVENAGYLARLDAGGLRAAGVPAPWGFGMADRVRFGELDALGHVNHTCYLRWFEALRVHYLANYGLSTYGPDDMLVVLKSIGAEFHAPMFLNQSYIALARTVRFRTSSFQMVYGIWCEGRLTVEGQALIVALEQDGKTKRPLTAAMCKALSARDGAVGE